MRRMMGLLLAVLVAVGCLPAMAESDPYRAAVITVPESGDMTLDDALVIAKEAISTAAGEAFVSHHGMTASFLTIALQGETQRAWHIVLCNGVRNEVDAYAATVLSPSGEVAGVDRFFWHDRRAAWEADMGPYPLWTIEDKALFYALYTGTADDGYGNGVPQANDLTAEAAVEIARAALIADKHADAEEMETLMLSTWFQVSLAEGSEAADYWCVLYVKENPEAPGGYDTIYQANVTSPDGAVEMLYSLHEDGPGNG